MRVTVGGYATAAQGWDTEELASFYGALADLPSVEGLELPSAQLDPLADGQASRLALAGHLDCEVTTLPATMSALQGSAEYGLASVSTAGRAAALADLERTRIAVSRFNDRLGRPSIRAVTLVSAPARDPMAPAGPARAAFAESLVELGTRDWGGASLIVEHCDAAVPGQVAAKGFLDLADELDVLAALPGTPVRATINWGRSAIEGRDPAAATAHARLARERGLLACVVLAGCASTPSAWGEPWADTHLPPAGVHPPGVAPHESLMTRQAMTDFLHAAGAAARVSVKFSIRPREADRQARTRFLAAALADVRLAWNAARETPAPSADRS